MRAQRFQIPGSLYVERQVRREGPSPIWVVWKPHISMGFTDRKAALRFCAWPASTPTGQELRAWFKDTDEPVGEAPDLDMAKVAAEGFGPEAHLEESDPNYQTKTVI